MYLRELAIISFLICSCVPQKLFWALTTWNKRAADTFTRHVSVNGCTCFDRSISIWIEPYTPQYQQVIELCLSLCPTDFEHTVIDIVGFEDI